MRMMNTLRTLILGSALALVTTGCFTVDMLFKVRPDGSGDIEVTTTVKKDFVEQMAAFAGVEVPEGEGGAGGQLFSEAKLQEQADKLGPGVKLVRHEMISSENVEGVRAFYTFTDIGALRADVMGAAPGNDGGGEGLDLKFEKGGGGKPSVITAQLPKPELPDSGGDSAGKTDEAGDPEAAKEFSMDDPQMQMMAQMFSGLKFRIALEVQGKLVSSNAPKVEGNRSILLDVDFDKMMASPEKLGSLFAAEPSSLADLQKLTTEIPGLVVPLVEELRIEFTGK